MKIELVLFDELEPFSYKSEIMPTPYDIAFSYYVDEDNKLYSFLENEKILNNAARRLIKTNGHDSEFEDEPTLKAAKQIVRNSKKIIDNIEYVRLAFNHRDALTYIDETPYLHNKKIVVPDRVDINSHDDILNVLKKYKNYSDNIYIVLENNNDYVSLKDAFKTIITMEDIASEIIGLNLSPMEAIMYTYDLVKERIYKFEDSGARYTESRDLSSILNNDCIVCTGYANLLNAILGKIGIKGEVAGLTVKKNKNAGHARSIIHVVDPKYNIDGVYYFDPTWDSKIDNEDTSYINKYVYFAKTRKQTEKLENKRYEYDRFPEYNDNLVNDVKDILNNFHFEDVKKNEISAINYMSRIVNDKYLINLFDYVSSKKMDKEYIIGETERLCNLFDKPLDAETLIKIFNNVRKVEYYQNPKKYTYNEANIYSTALNSKWQFRQSHKSGTEKLLETIFGNDYKLSSKERYRNDVENTILEEKIDQDIAQTKFTKVLSLYNKSRK